MAQEEEFQCRAINDYYASVTDELDLKEGQIYTIMQTSPSGWWYAVNEDGEDGWVPSNYLERIDENDDGGNDNNKKDDKANKKNDDDDGDDDDGDDGGDDDDDDDPPKKNEDKKNVPIVQPQQYQNVDDGAPGM